jgi:hypothetical protein
VRGPLDFYFDPCASFTDENLKILTFTSRSSSVKEVISCGIDDWDSIRGRWRAISLHHHNQTASCQVVTRRVLSPGGKESRAKR